MFPEAGKELVFNEISLSKVAELEIDVPRKKTLQSAVLKSFGKGNNYPFTGHINGFVFDGEVVVGSEALLFGWSQKRIDSALDFKKKRKFISASLRFAKAIEARFVFLINEPADEFEHNFSYIDNMYVFAEEYPISHFAVCENISVNSYDTSGFLYIDSLHQFRVYQKSEISVSNFT